MSIKESSLPEIAGIILAAGKGTRMKSPIPKVLHEVAGKTMLAAVLECLKEAGVQKLAAVIGGDLEYFDGFLNTNPELSICIQENRQGTGDAVAAAAVCFDGVETPSYSSRKLVRGVTFDAQYVIICAGDTPAMDSQVIKDFIHFCIEKSSDLGVLGMEIPDPTGYGRLVIENESDLTKIVEQKDADPETQKINVVNSGVILAKKEVLFQCLAQITPNNAQKEYYLTDCIEIAKREGLKTLAFTTQDWEGFSGVNSPEQKAEIEKVISKRK